MSGEEATLPPLPNLLALRAQVEEAKITTTAPVAVNDHPLQAPGVDEHLQRAQVGGPESGQDARLVISVGVLEALREVATRSSTRRAVIFGAGFLLTTYEAKGHRYQMLTILGRRPVPEVSALVGVQEIPTEEDVLKEPAVTLKDHDPGRKVAERVVGGPSTDLRLFLSQNLLDHLLDRARASRTLRAVIHGAGLVFDTYRTPAGGVYQIVTVAGRKPVPEDPNIVLATHR